MDTTRPALAFTTTLSKAFTNLLRFTRVDSDCGNGGVALSEPDLHNFKFSGTNTGEPDKEMDKLAANIFAGISAIKASYAQLQVAQLPYDPDAIQSADRAIVAELKRLSVLKQSFLKNQVAGEDVRPAPLDAQIEEQRNLLKTYKITTAKLDSELRSKESEIVSLQSELQTAKNWRRFLEARLRSDLTAALSDLHLSGLNAGHFLTLFRRTIKSIGSFVKIMTREMCSAVWDIDAAARAIQPDLHRRNSEDRVFAFESYVSRLMFSDFQNPDFGLGELPRDRRRFFKEFSELKCLKPNECFEKKSQFGMFCRKKYLGMVHPRMEAAFFGGLDNRAMVSSGRGFPATDFFHVFAEMTRQVWLLHCLFFSFGAAEEKMIFEARRGSRFSEVYMESVAEEEATSADGGGARTPVVGFTVVPGFKVGRTVIQCRVYLITGDS
ncbi:hypothetical protein KSP40_PGU007047 [Platanthera guangdongensis]|uniref:DUF641 domain-containing protein n=1 Tax=Platanthera guangdongensis TaxID=2320717 RepID=A0ABR2M093_9ASPA